MTEENAGGVMSGQRPQDKRGYRRKKWTRRYEFKSWT